MSILDRIMFPEVPIALRMSGHLLLGIVRIYSKKVEYLFQDCNVVLNGLRKAFASIDLNLPEDARQAPIQLITLPDKFDLDSLDLDDDIYRDGYNSWKLYFSVFFTPKSLFIWQICILILILRTPDNHLRSQEEITLTGYQTSSIFLSNYVLFQEVNTLNLINFHARSKSYWKRPLCCYFFWWGGIPLFFCIDVFCRCFHLVVGWILKYCNCIFTNRKFLICLGYHDGGLVTSRSGSQFRCQTNGGGVCLRMPSKILWLLSLSIRNATLIIFIRAKLQYSHTTLN